MDKNVEIEEIINSMSPEEREEYRKEEERRKVKSKEDLEMEQMEEEIEEEKKSKNTGSMLYGAETNPEMAEKFRKVQETHESQKAQNQKIANAINDVAETMESKERKTPVTGRRDPAHARSSKFIKVDWKPNEISNKAENLSANKDFKDNFIKTADELLGAGRFLWTGSDQYKQLKESVKACKQLMEKQGKMDPAEYNKQLQEHMETIIGKAGNYLKYKSQYAGKDEELKKQSSTAQSRYTAANKMWNLLVDQKKELEVYNAFSERSAIEMERADRKINQAAKTINEAKKSTAQVENSIKEKTIENQQATKKVEKVNSLENLQTVRAAVNKLERSVYDDPAVYVGLKADPKAKAEINENLRTAYKEQGKMEISYCERNKRLASRELRRAESPEEMLLPLAKLILQNHVQKKMMKQVLDMNKLPKGAQPSKLAFVSEEQMEKQVDVLSRNPKLMDKCKDFFQNPKKMDSILCDRQDSNTIEISENIAKLGKEFQIKKRAPEHAPTRQVVNDAPDFSMGMH